MNKFELFHKEYPGVSLSSLSYFSGVNNSLIRQYAVGIKTPSKDQLTRLEAGIHAVGRSLLNIKIS